MIVEDPGHPGPPDVPDLPSALVGAAVEHEWGVSATNVERLDDRTEGRRWLVGDDGGPQWVASLDVVRTAEERRARTLVLAAAAELALRLSFVVAPVHARDGRVAITVAPGLLLSVAPYLDGTVLRAEDWADDPERSVVANMMGDLHRQRRPRDLPVWRPRIGWHPQARRDDLERLLTSENWTGGPWSVPAGRLVLDARPVLRRAIRRFALLGAAVAGNAECWVVTHGETHTGNLVRTPDGHRLVGWDSVALAPRERDLSHSLGGAEGTEPWFAYLESGGRPEPLSPDTVELFALERHLSAVADHGVRLSRSHEDTTEERRRFGELEQELGAVLERWS